MSNWLASLQLRIAPGFGTLAGTSRYRSDREGVIRRNLQVPAVYAEAVRVLGLLVLCGCRQLLGLDDPSVVQDAPAGDAPPGCIMAASVFSGFDDPNDPCGGIGFVNNFNSVIAVGESQLRVTPMAGIADSAGGCVATVTQPFDTGVFVEVSTPVKGPSEYMIFTAHWDDQTHLSTIAVDGAQLSFLQERDVKIGTTPQSASTRWWRMRPREDGGAILAETSPDGQQWTVFATDERTAPLRITIELGVGVFANESSPTTAVVEGINVCP